MIIKKYPAPPIEDAASRYDRDWLNIPDLDTAGEEDYRHDRTLLRQPVERKSRRYVDDGVSAVTGGAPVFDPDESGEDGGDSLEPLWTDDFEGDSLDARWNLLEGDALLDPLRPNKDVASSIRFYTGPEDYSRIDIVFDDSTKFGITLMDESLMGMYALIEQFDDNLVADKGDNIASIPIARGELRELSLIINENSLRMIANGMVSDELVTPLSTPIAILIDMQGSIRSISTYESGDNGGGTPEPEPEIPSEPEVPEGSYQEIYTETY